MIYMKLETGNLTRIVQDTVHSSKQNWKGATQHEKSEYKNSLQAKLNNISVPECIETCRDVHCNNNKHKEDIDNYIIELIECMEKAAQENIPYTGSGENRGKKKCRKPVPGWSELVEPHKQDARFWYQLWLSGGKPKNGSLYQNMRISRSNYRSAKRKCTVAAEKIKRDKFVEACLNGDRDMFEEDARNSEYNLNKDRRL